MLFWDGLLSIHQVFLSMQLFVLDTLVVDLTVTEGYSMRLLFRSEIRGEGSGNAVLHTFLSTTRHITFPHESSHQHGSYLVHSLRIKLWTASLSTLRASHGPVGFRRLIFPALLHSFDICVIMQVGQW